jgi:hypothetical protein
VGATDARAEVDLTMRVAVDSMFAFCWPASKFDMGKGHGAVKVLNFAESTDSVSGESQSDSGKTPNNSEI